MNTPISTLPGFVKPDNTDQVFFYEQDFYVLSNFSAFRLRWEWCDFDTSEAAYHWEKFGGDDEKRADLRAIRTNIMRARSAHDAFKIAEQNRAHRRTDWDEIKVDVMRGILRAKADQHEYVRRKLLATGDRQLIEDSWRDDFWGWGPNRSGQNMLGKLWMEIRAELRQTPDGVPASDPDRFIGGAAGETTYGVPVDAEPCAKTYAGCAPDCHAGNRCTTGVQEVPSEPEAKR